MTTITTSKEYEQLLKQTKDAHLLGTSIGLLHWDQEVMMPKKGIDFRADQIALTSKLHHELSTDPKIGDWLSACEEDPELQGDPTSSSAVNIREIRHHYDRATKLPTSLIEEEAKLSSHGQNAWAEARKNNEFSEFQP